jgi:beta-lactamase superfamily II metal-dependent hydrolase
MTIRKKYHVDHFYDYQNLKTGQILNVEKTRLKILNSYKNGEEENLRSLSFKLEYKGFIYVHGGDTYGINQSRILKEFPEDIAAHVFSANHHFHGSVDIEYLRAMNPFIVFIQAQEAVYARRAYMEDFKEKTVGYLLENKKNFLEDLLTLETGTVVIRVNGQDDWTYETYYDPGEKRIPFLFIEN